MLATRWALPAGTASVAALFVPLALLGQGCKKQPAAEPADSAISPPAAVDDSSAHPAAAAPQAEEVRPPAAPAKGPEPGTVEATDVTDETFAEFTGKGVAMVDFWSPRCPPCRLQGPIVEKLAGTFAGRAAIGKLRVDLHRNAPGKFRIMYIPTLIIFRDGQEVKRLTGLQEEATLVAALEAAIKGK
jgi:thioredoxin 1